jgi:hypothetical protein
MKSVGWFAIDQVLGTVGVAASAPLIFFQFCNLLLVFGWTYPVLHRYPILSENPYFPVQITLGLMLGLMVGSCARRPSMLWIWVLPLLLLCYAVAEIPTISPLLSSMLLQSGATHSRLSHYFGWGCQPRDRCIDQLLVTMPFYASVAFSVGALSGQQMDKHGWIKPQWRLRLVLAVAIVFLVAPLVDLGLSLRVGWYWSYPLVVGVPIAIGAYLVALAFRTRRQIASSDGAW